MPQNEWLLPLARQYFKPTEYQDFVALLALMESPDKDVRLLAVSEINPLLERLLSEIQKNKAALLKRVEKSDSKFDRPVAYA